MKNLYVSFFVFIFSFCTVSDKSIRRPKSEVIETIPIKISRTYITGKQPAKNSSDDILKLVEFLVAGVLKKDFSELPKNILKEKGIYLDLKGLWTYEELIRELSLADSYFSIFFFDAEKLKIHKQSNEVLTVRDLLILSEGLELDLFFESPNSCEIKIRFNKNQKFEKDLNNPYFIQYNGKWYIYRLF